MEEPQAPIESTLSPPSLLGLGVAWTRVGYGVLALSIVAFVLWQTVHPVLQATKGAPIPEGYRLMANKDGGLLLRASTLGMVSVFLLVFSGLAGFVWTLADLVDRRRRFVWILPVVICVFLQGLHALPLALYVFYGRETMGPNDNV